MKQFTIDFLQRDVELNDELVKEYEKYDELHEQPFCIIIKTKFGHKPTKEELPDNELSQICNEILLSELKAFSMLPKAIEIAENNFTKTNVQPMEFKL